MDGFLICVLVITIHPKKILWAPPVFLPWEEKIEDRSEKSMLFSERSSIFSSLSPKNSMNFRGTRRLPSKIASDFRRQTSVSSHSLRFFYRAIHGSIKKRGARSEIGAPGGMFFPSHFMARKKTPEWEGSLISSDFWKRKMEAIFTDP